MEGTAPMPPAAVLLGWELSWVAPERGEIEVLFEAGDLFDDDGQQVASATATARVVRPDWAGLSKGEGDGPDVSEREAGR
jgi:hypothetical protein